jgi:hypothetical protein
MKNLLLCLLFSGTLSVLPVMAQDKQDEHASHHPQGSAAQDGASDAGEHKGQAMMDNMKKIQELMARIHATTDPAEREALMKEHLKAMREQAKMMHAMADDMGGMMGDKGGMMGDGGGMMGDESESDKGKPADGTSSEKKKGMMMGAMMKMHKMMQKRMGMMQMMIEQMLEREAVESGVEHQH